MKRQDREKKYKWLINTKRCLRQLPRNKIINNNNNKSRKLPISHSQLAKVEIMNTLREIPRTGFCVQWNLHPLVV